MPYQSEAFQPGVGTQDFEIVRGSSLGGGRPMNQRGIQLENLVEDARFAMRPENLVEENDEGFDVLEEKNLIVGRMLGERSSMDPSFKAYLNCVVGIYQRLQTREPKQCQQECLHVNDPAECCWNMKLAEGQSSLKKYFQIEITVSVNNYLRIHRKKVSMLPLHCTEALSAWTRANYDKPYMLGTMVVKMAEELGVTENQINQWLENWRARTWNPIPEGHNGRKGIKFRHSKEDTTKIKNWILERERFPSKEEANIMSTGLRMTPIQILDHANNLRKRQKHLFKYWK